MKIKVISLMVNYPLEGYKNRPIQDFVVFCKNIENQSFKILGEKKPKEFFVELLKIEDVNRFWNFIEWTLYTNIRLTSNPEVMGEYYGVFTEKLCIKTQEFLKKDGDLRNVNQIKYKNEAEFLNSHLENINDLV